ncbi:MAG: alkyl hydroperoxide reductase [Bacteroidetes bacterium MED-G17]|jgi:peroxiredoxin (alkyl hydroperoxide reductase subunit C)|nr:MAG: alkyl hydroperoxide reductase [Bacteroidetes bacterium TMED39]PDH52942.1 MAG: alkyl hydroperoxide reductase [Bacteroidetes bacterium MED-G17]CAI8264985.1 MAG: putative peroxiredoxin [Bacteroidetes bacterium MED-G17]|tara:strand:- start:14072 stop:14701 length:630 start_codon:yes stop_codon:yes gene_type:complete
MVLTGKKAPSFSTGAVINGEELVEDFSLDQYLGKKNVVLFFYPKDFTFVCPTELHAFQEKLDEFRSRDTEVVACSCDSQESHWGWLQVSKDNGGIKGINYPIIADFEKTVSTNFGVLHGEYEYDEEGNLTTTGPMKPLRGLFLIDKNGLVQHQVVNMYALGRSVDEALRMVDALAHFEEKGEVCPANWEKGKDALHETFEGVADYLSKH